MNFFKKYQKTLFIILLVVILFYNSYNKSYNREGYSGGANNINKQFDDINNKYKKLKIVISMLQAEISLIKDTINKNIN